MRGLARMMLITACGLVTFPAGACATEHDPAGENDTSRASAVVSATSSTPVSHPTGVRAGANRALAIRASRHVFHRFPVPAGSIRLHAAPARAPFLRHLRAEIGEVDPTLTRTGWWLVPLGYDRVVAWYVARTPADPGSALYADGSGPAPASNLYWRTQGRSPAYSTPVDIASYARLGPRLTAIRTDVTVAARADRTPDTLAPAEVMSLEVTRKAIDGADTAPTTVTVADQSQIAAVTSAFNALQGAYAGTRLHPCGSPTGIVQTYAVTFHGPDHTLAVDAGAALCGIGRGLTLNGTELPQTLEDDPSVDRALEAAFDTISP